jgi:hypothetical protein
MGIRWIYIMIEIYYLVFMSYVLLYIVGTTII